MITFSPEALDGAARLEAMQAEQSQVPEATHKGTNEYDPEALAITLRGYVSDFMGAKVEQMLEQADGKDITLRINSFGGSSFAGMSVFNDLQDYKGKVTTINTGIAASAASMIFAAGEDRIVKTGSRLMIHDVSIFMYGNAATLKKYADLMENLSADYASVYAEVGKYDEEKFRDLMRTESYLSAKDAMESGLATRLSSSKAEKESRATRVQAEERAPQTLDKEPEGSGDVTEPVSDAMALAGAVTAIANAAGHAAQH